MALRTSYNDTNKVVSSKLQIRYSVEPSDDEDYYVVTRTASMSYAFVGMDEATATACGVAKVAQYTREYSKIKTVSGQTVPSAVTVRECKTGVSVDRQQGDAWDVNITVNETDVKATATAPDDPATLFASENARNYDGGNYGDALTISTASRDGSDNVRIVYAENIRSYDKDRIVAEYKESESGSWISATLTTNTYSSSTHRGALVFSSAAAVAVRIVYGSIESAVISVTEAS